MMVSEQDINVKTQALYRIVKLTKNRVRRREVKESVCFLKFHKKVNRDYAKLKHNFKNMLTLPQCLSLEELVNLRTGMSLIL